MRTANYNTYNFYRIGVTYTPNASYTFHFVSFDLFCHINICRPDDLEKRPHADRFNASINNLYKNQKFQYVEVQYSMIRPSVWLSVFHLYHIATCFLSSYHLSSVFEHSMCSYCMILTHTHRME